MKHSSNLPVHEEERKGKRDKSVIYDSYVEAEYLSHKEYLLAKQKIFVDEKQKKKDLGAYMKLIASKDSSPSKSI